jgi:Uma2 family endonuclease
MHLMAIARVRPFPPPPAPAPGPWTAADVERFPDDGYRYEIWHGELVRMAPAGGRHGECEANLVAALRQQTRAVGRVYTGDTGFLLREHPHELVSPDVAFVRHDRLPPPAERISYLRVVPDLVVEIRSPNDAEADVRAKLSLYLEVGVPLVWIVDPHDQTLEEVRTSASRLGDSRLMRADAGDVLHGADLLRGFRLALADIFE